VRALFCLPASLLLLAACGSSPSSEPAESAAAPTSAGPPALTIAEALREHPAGPFAVKGLVLALGSDFVRLCTSGTNEFPPFCGSPTLTLVNLDPQTVPGIKHESSPEAWWTESPYILQGTLSGHTFKVASG
jgi:hypothetical protein